MTLDQMEQRVQELERALQLLKDELLRLRGVTVLPGFGPVGTFRDDPDFWEAVRLGRQYRDLVNRDAYVDPLLTDEPPTPKKAKKTARKKPTLGSADAGA